MEVRGVDSHQPLRAHTPAPSPPRRTRLSHAHRQPRSAPYALLLPRAATTLGRGAWRIPGARHYFCRTDRSSVASGTATVPRSSGRGWTVKNGTPSVVVASVRDA